MPSAWHRQRTQRLGWDCRQPPTPSRARAALGELETRPVRSGARRQPRGARAPAHPGEATGVCAQGRRGRNSAPRREPRYGTLREPPTSRGRPGAPTHAGLLRGSLPGSPGMPRLKPGQRKAWPCGCGPAPAPARARLACAPTHRAGSGESLAARRPGCSVLGGGGGDCSGGRRERSGEAGAGEEPRGRGPAGEGGSEAETQAPRACSASTSRSALPGPPPRREGAPGGASGSDTLFHRPLRPPGSELLPPGPPVSGLCAVGRVLGFAGRGERKVRTLVRTEGRQKYR